MYSNKWVSILVPFVGLSFFYWSVLFNFDITVLFYLITSYHIALYCCPLEACLFSSERPNQKDWILMGREKGRKLGGVEEQKP